MRILYFEDIKIEKELIIDSITNGTIFIYPTDTIYGIGCNAQVSTSVKKIRGLKARAANPFSVIAPSLGWIHSNCIVTKNAETWLGKLPGPYTLILKLKNNNCIAKEVNPGLKTLGIRMPKHWIWDLIAEADVPVVTSSVNKSNEDYMTCLEDLDPAIKGAVGFILYDGERDSKPSKIIDLTENVRVIER